MLLWTEFSYSQGDLLMLPFCSSSEWSISDLSVPGISRQWLRTENQLLLRNFLQLTSGYFLWLKTFTVLFVMCMYLHGLFWFWFYKWVYVCSLISLLVLFICYFSKWLGWTVLQLSWVCHSKHCLQSTFLWAVPFAQTYCLDLWKRLYSYACVCTHTHAKLNTEIKTESRKLPKPSRPKEVTSILHIKDMYAFIQGLEKYFNFDIKKSLISMGITNINATTSF